MDQWSVVLLDWVNCLRLTENPLHSLQDLGDGKFFCEILQLLFKKTVDIKNKAQIFQFLEEKLKNTFTPPEWIDFREAYEGNTDELIKIASVLVALGSLQCEESNKLVFVENPLNHLGPDAHITLHTFLSQALDNGKVVDQSFLTENKENECGLKHNNAKWNQGGTPTRRRGRFSKPIKRNKGENLVPESPHFYTSSPSANQQTSPLRDLLSSPILAAERILMSEKNNEILSLKNRIDVLTACQSDLMEEITSYKEENKQLKLTNDDLEKEKQNLRLQAISSTLYSTGSPAPTRFRETPDKSNSSLKEKLRKAEEYIDQIENRLYNRDVKFRELEQNIEELKSAIGKTILREEELVEILQKTEQEKEHLQQILDDQKDNIRKLQQEVEDYRDCGGSSSGNQTHDIAGISGLSLCESFGRGSPSKQYYHHQISNSSFPEDLASTVVEVQLRETQEKLSNLMLECQSLTQKNSSILEECTGLKHEHKVLEETAASRASELAAMQESYKCEVNKVAELEEVQGSLQNTIAELQGKIESLTQELHTSSSQLETKTAAFESLNEELTHLKNDHKDLEEAAASRASELAALEESYKCEVKKVAELEEVQGSLQETISELQGKIERLTQELHTSSSQLETKTAAFESLNEELSHLKNDHKDLEEAAASRASELAALEESYKCEVNKVAELEELQGSLQETISELGGKNERLTQELHTSSSQLETKTAAFESLNEELSHLKNDHKDLEEAAASRASELAALEESYKCEVNKVAELEEVQGSLEETISELGGKIERLTQELHTSSSQLETKTAAFESLNEEMTHLKSEHKDLEEAAASRASQLAALEESYKSEVNKVAELEEVQGSLQNTISELQGKIERLTQELHTSSSQLETKTAAFESLNEELTHLKNDHKDLEEAAASRASELAALEELYKCEVKKVAELEEVQGSLQETISELGSKIERLTEELCTSSCVLETKTAAFNSLSETHSSVLQELIDLKQDLRTLQEDAKSKAEELTRVEAFYRNEVRKVAEVETTCCIYMEKLSCLENLNEEMRKNVAKLTEESTARKEELNSMEVKYSELVNTNEQTLLELGQLQKQAEDIEALTISRVRSECLLESERLVGVAVKETQEKFSKKFEDKKRQMQEIAQKEIDRREQELKEQKRKVELALENAEKSNDEIDDLKRDRAKLRGSNIELSNKIFGLEDSLSKSQKRVLNLESHIHDLQGHITSLEQQLKSAMNEEKMFARSCSKNLLQEGYVNQSYISDKDNSFSSLPPIYPSSRQAQEDSSRRLSMISVKSTGSATSGRSKAVPDGAGRYFSCEDEEDLFSLSSKNLEDLKKGRCGTSSSIASRLSDVGFVEADTFGRLSELQRRNTMMPIHMRSCYPGEELAVPIDENQLKGLPGARASRRNFAPGASSGLCGKSISGPNVRSHPSNGFSGNASNEKVTRTPFSPTSINVNNGDLFRRPDGVMKTKMKSDSALTPSSKMKRGLFRNPFGR